MRKILHNDPSITGYLYVINYERARVHLQLRHALYVSVKCIVIL